MVLGLDSSQVLFDFRVKDEGKRLPARHSDHNYGRAPPKGQAGKKAAGEMWKNLASVTTCALVSDRVPFRTEEMVDCAMSTFFASFAWLSPLARSNSRSTSASEASGIGWCSSS